MLGRQWSLDLNRASIDIGSNTVLLLAASFSEDGSFERELLNESRVTSLGKDLDKTGVFAKKSIKETEKALTEYVELLKGINIVPEDVIVTATEASRVAKNSHELFSKVKSELGLNVTIINGEGEAYYTSLGVTSQSELGEEFVTIMDIGGASTELIKVRTRPFSVESSISLPIGSVRCTDWLKEKIFAQKVEEIFRNFDVTPYETDHLLCVAGSMTSLGSMIKGLTKFDSDQVNGTRISFSDFLKFTEKIKKRTPTELLLKFPFLGKRSKSIVGGAYLGEQMGKALKVNTFEISTLGLRYGTITAGGIDERFCE
jgi:exopolyphosphatase/guanosine-5'-triphosphate,3'-diphosphate pyrophosphatase